MMSQKEIADALKSGDPVRIAEVMKQINKDSQAGKSVPVTGLDLNAIFKEARRTFIKGADDVAIIPFAASLVNYLGAEKQAQAMDNVAEAIRELAEKGIAVDVDTTAIAEALTEVNIEIKDLVEISNAITNMATGIENLNIENVINIGDTAKKLQVTAKELERTAKKLEATERGS
jgi:hypothetical protein